MLKSFASWFLARLAEQSSKAAILSVGLVWCGVLVAHILSAPMRVQVAGAVVPTFIGALAFLYKETPAQLQAEIAKVETPSPIIPA